MDTLLIVLLLAPWFLGAALSTAIRPYRRWVGGVIVGGGLVSVGAASALWLTALTRPAIGAGALAIFRVDALSALVAFCVSVVATLAMVFAPQPASMDRDDRRPARVFRTYGGLFAFAMLAAVTVNNIALMWVAIEATTITSALLVPLHRSRASVEASWKYLLIGSVGIALAFAGTVLAYFAFVAVTADRGHAVDWALLASVAPGLNAGVMRLAFVFLLVGYGTKAGLAPMHTWLPDAHSEAPAPLSAMMSGVLLAVAQYAILRWKTVVDSTAGGAAFTETTLLALGLLSIAIGALSLVRQQSYKRLLAYSSIEHSGLICIGLTFGPAGVLASLLHLLNHAIAKSMSFLLSGRILARYGTTDVLGVRGLARTMPVTGPLFAAGALALMGLPPFGLFVSEFLLFRAGFMSGHIWETTLALVLAGIGFIAIAAHVIPMVTGAAPEHVTCGEGGRWAVVPLLLCAVALVVLGLAMPWPVGALLDHIVEAITV